MTPPKGHEDFLAWCLIEKLWTSPMSSLLKCCNRFHLLHMMNGVILPLFVVVIHERTPRRVSIEVFFVDTLDNFIPPENVNPTCPFGFGSFHW
jgi:hypothetical protein